MGRPSWKCVGDLHSSSNDTGQPRYSPADSGQPAGNGPQNCMTSAVCADQRGLADDVFQSDLRKSVLRSPRSVAPRAIHPLRADFVKSLTNLG